MAQDVPSYFHSASYKSVSWVEVWLGEEQLGVEETKDGAVTATWQTAGPRRTLALQVPPTSSWLEWLRIGVELRPFRGIKYTEGDIVLPLGRFPVRKFSKPLSAKTISVNAQDRWQWVTASPFGRIVNAYSGRAVDIASFLMEELDPYGWGRVAQKSATSEIQTPPGIWSGTRSDTIGDLVEAAGAEAFFDRLGRPTVRDRPGRTTPVVSIRSGSDGVLIDSVEEIDWEKVVNYVTVSCTATDTTLEPVSVGISDPEDPAHRLNISGKSRSGGFQVMGYSSSAFTTQDEMIIAGQALLAKNAVPAQQWSVQMPPDVSLDESDTVLLETRDGDVEAQIQSITYPLNADASSTLSCSSARDLS